MGIFDFFKKKENSFDTLYKTVENQQNLLELDQKVKEDLLIWDAEQKALLVIDIINTAYKQESKFDYYSKRRIALNLISSFLVKRKVEYGNHTFQLLNLILEKLKDEVESKRKDNRFYNHTFTYLVKPFLTNIIRFQIFESLEEKETLIKIKSELEVFDQYHYNNEIKKTIQKIEDILFEVDKNSKSGYKPTYFMGKDEFQSYGNIKIDNLNAGHREYCFQIIALAQKSSGGKPSKRYLDESKSLIEAFGNDNFKVFSQDLFEFVIDLKEKTTTHTSKFDGREYTYDSIEFLDSLNAEVLKGLVWMNSKFHDKKTIFTIGKLAERCFKKIQGKGPSAAGLGNACLYTLYASKGLDGIAQLSKLKLKIKHNSTLDLIEKYINEAAIKLGVSSSEVEDLAVDDFKLSFNKLEFFFGDIKGVIELTGIGKSVVRWFKEDNKEQKTVPQSVKDNFSEKLKKLKDKQKQIDQATSVQKERFDRMLRTNRLLSIDYFKEKFIGHGLLSFVINKVIFKFGNANYSKLAIFINQKWIDLEYKELEINNYEEVSLWHPATSSTQEVKEWRQFLLDSEIQQPFKQAFREIYLLTEAEINTRTYSNRMASHILKQHQYVTLAKGRNWKARLIGSWDGGDQDTAELYLSEFKIKVEYWVNALNADNEWNDSGIWNYVTTDQIRFINSETKELIELIDVPTVAFSEAMRDIDLFVGVASVGNDPTWSDSGGLPTYRDYWQSYSFGDLSELAKNRKEILLNLIPRLKISNVASISDKFLIIKGKLRTYKIHIGSTNILMEPNDQYLCIVPDRGKKNETENVFLPFEGDNGLSVIISKAFLLANDDKITDSSIISQINR